MAPRHKLKEVEPDARTGRAIAQESARHVRGASAKIKGAASDLDVDGTPGVSQETSALAEKALLEDIDAILARLETGIAKNNAAVDILLERLRQPAA